MNVNIPQISSNQRTNSPAVNTNSTDSPVAKITSETTIHNRALRLLIGTVNNKNEPLTTNELTEKTRSARIAGIIAMAVGITLCILATALVAGFGLPLIPLAPIFALGLAACLYGVVITVVASKPLIDINVVQAPDEPFEILPGRYLSDAHQIPDDSLEMPADGSLPYEYQAFEKEYINPIFENSDSESIFEGSDRGSIQAPPSEAAEDTETTGEKPAFYEWLKQQKLSDDPNLVSDKKIKALSCKQIIKLKEYDLSQMNISFQLMIAEKIKSLIDSTKTSIAEKDQLIELVKLFLDQISTYSSPLYSYQVNDCYRMLIPCLNIASIPTYSLGSSKEDTSPVRVVANNISKESELKNKTFFDAFAGAHRDVYINKTSGVGYKIIKRQRDPNITLLTDDALRNSDDLRLNAIYKDKNFYGGRYREYACFRLVRIEREYDRHLIEALMFQKIPNAVSLAPDEKIPRSALKVLEDMGYFPYDVYPENFVKVFNSETKQYDYIPIDAKFIAYKKGSSIRTKDIKRYKEMSEMPYKEMSNIAFSK